MKCKILDGEQLFKPLIGLLSHQSNERKNYIRNFFNEKKMNVEIEWKEEFMKKYLKNSK